MRRDDLAFWFGGMKRRGSLVDLGAIFIVGLITLVFFRPVIWQNAWLPAGGGDLASFIFPMYRFIAASFHRGELPLWNPYQYSGIPLIGDNQSGIFYPPNLLLFTLSPDFSYGFVEALVIFHIFAAGAAFYICARGWRFELPIPPVAALVGAIAFMFSDLFITHVGNLNLIAVACWLPLIAITFRRSAAALGWRERCRYGIVSGLIMGASTLAGHGQITYYIGLWLLLYAIYHAVSARQLWPILLLLLVGAISFGLAAISIFPALTFQQFSLRADFDYERAAAYSLPLPGLLGMLAPDFFGRGARFWSDWARVEYGYMGILPWLLAASALVRSRERDRWFLALAAAIFLLLALGEHTPLHRWLFTILPLPFQAPARFVLLVNFPVALLAALGAARLTSADFRSSWHFWLPSGSALLLGLIALWVAHKSWGSSYPDRSGQMVRATIVYAMLAVIAWSLLVGRMRNWLRSSVFAGMAFVLVTVDLVTLGQYVEIEWNDPVLGYAHEQAISFLQLQTSLGRIDEATGQWQPSAAQMFGLYSIGGVYNPLALSHYNVYVGSVGYRGSPLYNLLGVEHVVAYKTEPPGDTNILVHAFTADPGVDIYRNTRVLPRAMVLYESQVVTDHDAAFDAIHASDFDPSKTVVLEGGLELHQAPGNYDIEWLQYENNEVRLRVTSDKDGYLLLTDTYYPEWQATVNGARVQILKADYAFRSLFVEAGSHEITMRFVPKSWYLGLTLSILTAVAAIVMFVVLEQRGDPAREQLSGPY